jgi:alkylation response protein AidB-like acyl-CoA dehydrogenase
VSGGFEDRQREDMLDSSRSSVSPDCDMRSIIANAQQQARDEAQRARSQVEQDNQRHGFHQRMRQSCADMADLIEHAKAGEFREADEGHTKDSR